MKKILLISTKGCVGCTIMRRNVREAINEKDIDFEVKDVNDVSKKFLNDYHIRDFPTTLFFIDNLLKFRWTGSMPVAVIVRWIDLYL